MGDYYDLFLAVDLRPDLPESVLDELRWHLGSTQSPPPEHTAVDFEGQGRPWPVFAASGESHGFDGVDTVQLVRRERRIPAVGDVAWALTVRMCVHEDELGFIVDALAWLLRFAITRGWVGYLRGPEPETIHHIGCDAGGFDITKAQTGALWMRVPWDG